MRRVSRKKAASRESAAYEAYQFMYQQVELRCWACGRDWQGRPSWWYAPWCLERAHIVNKPRVEDRRVVAILCSGCHHTAHGKIVSGWDLPKLTLGEMLWLKRKMDPEWYDLPFMQKCSVRRLPEPEPLRVAFTESYHRMRG